MSSFDYSEPLPFRGKWTCAACPVQAEGRLPDSRPWYFRARCGEWSVRVGEPFGCDAVSGARVAEGVDHWDGFMPAAEAARRIRSALLWHFDAARAASTGCAGTGDGDARCIPFAAWLRQMGLPHYELSAKGCTADEALRAEVS